MALKIFAGVTAIALLMAYLVPLALKLKEVSLTVVFAIGVAMMLADLWRSLRSGDQ